MLQRKVYFFKMDFRVREDVVKKDGETVAQYSYLNKDELKPYIDDMIEKYFREVKSGVMAKDLKSYSDTNVVETVDYRKENSYIIFKIGHEKATNTVGIRNKVTLELTDVPLDPDQNLEMFTYCIFDLNQLVCAIIQVYGAPTIAVLRNVFSNYFDIYHHELQMFITTSSILTNDIIDIVTGKEIISNVTATVSIPQQKVLDEVVYIDRKTFGELQNMRYTELTFSLVGKRSANMFKNPTQLKMILEKLQDKYGKGLKKFSVKAKNATENMQDYNILDYCLTKSVILSGEDVDSFTEKDIIGALKIVYNTSINEIQQYIR